MNKNLTQFQYRITKTERVKLNGHKPVTIWLTGYSGSGKSSIANLIEIELHKYLARTIILDGDNVRKGLNVDLGFSPKD